MDQLLNNKSDFMIINDKVCKINIKEIYNVQVYYYEIKCGFEVIKKVKYILIYWMLMKTR